MMLACTQLSTVCICTEIHLVPNSVANGWHRGRLIRWLTHAFSPKCAHILKSVLFVNSVAKAKRTTRLRECTLLRATAAVQCRCPAYSHHSLSNILHVCSFFTSSTVKTGCKYMSWINTGRGHFRQKEQNPQIYTAKKAYRIHVRNICGHILLDLIARRYT